MGCQHKMRRVRMNRMCHMRHLRNGGLYSIVDDPRILQLTPCPLDGHGHWQLYHQMLSDRNSMTWIIDNNSFGIQLDRRPQNRILANRLHPSWTLFSTRPEFTDPQTTAPHLTCFRSAHARPPRPAAPAAPAPRFSPAARYIKWFSCGRERLARKTRVIFAWKNWVSTNKTVDWNCNNFLTMNMFEYRVKIQGPENLRL